MRFILVFLLALSASSSLHAQAGPPPRARDAFFFELLGNGGLYSVNYERRLSETRTARIGIGAWTAEDLFSDSETEIVSVPATASWLMGNWSHKLELGGGLLGGYRSDAISSGGFLSATGIIAYRYEPTPGRFQFRTGLTPFVPLSGGEDSYPDDSAMVSIALSFGFRR